MNETQQRIKALQAALPHLRERVIAVALLLAMSLGMMTSASFAWLTISRAPAVTGVNTTIAANGNLEIALASEDGTTAPGESKVGDSSATEGQSVKAANLTWGNLVNLGDESYGLSNLTLRPAQLNTAALMTSPLYGAVYNKDGRIQELTSNFGYASWNEPQGNTQGYFGISEKFGVRAISSTRIEAVGADEKYVYLVREADRKNSAAKSTYLSLTQNSEQMKSLATMMGVYMTARMNSAEDLKNPTCTEEDVKNLRDMYATFEKAFQEEAEAIAALADLQYFLRESQTNAAFDYTSFTSYYTADMIAAASTASLAAVGIQITKLDQFNKDWKTVKQDYALLKTLADQGGDLKWKDTGLVNVVTNLADVGTCTLDGTTVNSIISQGVEGALGYLDGKTHKAVITNGMLYRFEERTGQNIGVQGMEVTVTVRRNIPILGEQTISRGVKADISTSAPQDTNFFHEDTEYAKSKKGNFVGGIATAEDTYGLAIDLWVRTNAQASYLTLEGNVLLSDPYYVAVTGKDGAGNTVDLYTLVITGQGEDGSTVSEEIDVYKIVTKNEDGGETTTWYEVNGHSVITEEQMNGVIPTPKTEEKRDVIGYEGENRVWNKDDNANLSVDATTQGSGSCYVYYADTPEDQAQSRKLLEALRVAFVDGEGKLLTIAEMDTERYYADSGRVIVPLVLGTDSIDLGKDISGNTIYAITALEKNVATRITAIVYLDGTKLTNEEVLAAADIQGRLNIQFGSSQNMKALSNEKLELAERSATAVVDKNEFHYDQASESNPMTTNVTITVGGDAPEKITAFFLRQINATQGSREEVMTFTKQTDGTWKAPYTFKAPGNYVLRTVQMDGVDYDLKEQPQVTIHGFTVEELTCLEAAENHVTVMTAASSSEVNLVVKFASSDSGKMPKTVQGRFLRDDGSATNINFAYNATTQTWRGSGTFLTSGNYTMQYLVVDGRYTELHESMWQTATVTLGMKVAIFTTSPKTFKYLPATMSDNKKLLGMQVKVMDNANNEMPGLTNVWLTYNMKGSGIKNMQAELKWDGQYYSGEMANGGPGVWQFSNVVVAGNTITSATTAPVFTIQSPEPPKYIGHNTPTYQYSSSNNAIMRAEFAYATTEEVYAYIVKEGASKGVWVKQKAYQESASGENQYVFEFEVPKDAAGYQDGNWTLTTLRLWDVFAADGTAYTEEEPLEIDVSGTYNKTKVVSRVFVTFAEDKSQNFGKDASGNVTGAFMQSHTISGLNVDIKDFEGQKVPNVSDVQLVFTYDNNSSSYGGYSNSSLTNATEGATITVALTDDGTGTHFVQTADATIFYAGSYTTTFSYKINGTAANYGGTAANALPSNAPKFTVNSVKPTVTIDSISPSGSHQSMAVSGNNSKLVNVNSTVTGNTVTIYAKKTNKDNGSIDITPSVTLKINNLGKAQSANLVFTASGGGTVYMYTNTNMSGRTDTYSWTSDSVTDSLYVGQYKSSGTCRGMTYEGAGTMISNSYITVIYDNIEYTVTVDPITIINNNPPY